jgi:hypothetical protein
LEKFMQDNAQQYKTLGSVGGAGSSATAGGYNQGNQIAGVRATGDSSPRMAGSPKAGGDVRVGGHFGPTASAANAASGYNQGDQFAASHESGITGSAPYGGAKAGGNILGGALDSQGNPKPAQAANGFNQGDMFAGKAK